MTSNSNSPDNSKRENELEHNYQILLTLWTNGVRAYNGLLSSYLTANSVFVAAIGFLLSRPTGGNIFVLLVIFFSVFGFIITLQMAIVLGRSDAQNDLWEWRLRGIERDAAWSQLRFIDDYHRLKNDRVILEDLNNNPTTLSPNWALRVHRRWWARRAVSFPLFFGIIYVTFLLWSLMQLL
jgi:hypothetical protein